jgi:branched-chain amino acid transport system permease protein
MTKLIGKSLIIAMFAALLLLPFKGIKGSVIVFLVIALTASIASVARKYYKTGRILSKIRITADSAAINKIKLPAVILTLMILSAFPFILKDYYIDIMVMAGIYVLLAAGLNVIVGFAGLLNLGFAAYYAIGAYSYALLNTKLGIDFWTALPISAVLASLAGIVIALPALRLRGDYLAIVTLGFGEIVRLVLNNWDSLTNGPNGISGIAPPSVLGISLGKIGHYYYVVFLIAALSIAVIRRVETSRIGRAWAALKENEIAASSSGVNTTLYKLYAFTFGTFWAGIAGALFAAKMQFVSPESFTFMESVLILSMVILGGLGSAYGAVIGAFILVLLPEMLREVQLYRMLILGIGLVFMMRFMPDGLMGKIKNAYTKS